MNRVLTLLALTIAGISAFAQSPQVTVAKDLDSSGMDAIYIQEIKLWKTLQADDRTAFKANLSQNFISIKDTIQNRDQLAISYKDCAIGSLNLQNHSTRALGADAVLISYRLHIEMICRKQSVVEESNATTTWVRQTDGHWLAVVHTESPIKATP